MEVREIARKRLPSARHPLATLACSLSHSFTAGCKKLFIALPKKSAPSDPGTDPKTPSSLVAYMNDVVLPSVSFGLFSSCRVSAGFSMVTKQAWWGAQEIIPTLPNRQRMFIHPGDKSPFP